MNRPRLAALIALIAALGLAGISFALHDRGGCTEHGALSGPATATTTTGPIATTTLAATTTTAAVTSTTAAPPSTTVAPAPSTTAIVLPPTAVTTGVTTRRRRRSEQCGNRQGAQRAHDRHRPRSRRRELRTRRGDLEADLHRDADPELVTPPAPRRTTATRRRRTRSTSGCGSGRCWSQAGAPVVVMTRTTNDGWGPCIDRRAAAIGNAAHADRGALDSRRRRSGGRPRLSTC